MTGCEDKRQVRGLCYWSNSLLPRQNTLWTTDRWLLGLARTHHSLSAKSGAAFEPCPPFSELCHTARSYPTAATAGQAEMPPVKKGAGKKRTHSATWMILSRNREGAIVATTRLGPMTATGTIQEPLIPRIVRVDPLCGAHSTNFLRNSRSSDQRGWLPDSESLLPFIDR